MIKLEIMKKISFLIALFFLCFNVLGQEKEVIMLYPATPTFPGGEQAMVKFISDNLQYPSQETNTSGKVIVKFLVKIDGSIDSIHTTQKLYPNFDKEAIRVVSIMPKWIQPQSHAQDTWLTLPICFTLKEQNRWINFGIDSILTNPEIMPEFPEGSMAMKKYISENFKHPIEEKDMAIVGRIIIKCTISKTGEVKDAKVIRGVSPHYDKEALRVVNSMPKWKAGRRKGENVDMKYSIPIIIR